MFDYLPVIKLQPDELPGFFARKEFSNRHVYAAEFYETDMFEPKDPVEPFDLDTYFTEPERYQARFADFLPYLSAIVNGIYWAPEYPRLISKKELKAATRKKGNCPLIAIGDITCDIEGSIEMTMKAMTSTKPVYVYYPTDDSITDGFAGTGIAMMTIDSYRQSFRGKQRPLLESRFYRFYRHLQRQTSKMSRRIWKLLLRCAAHLLRIVENCRSGSNS